MENNHFNVAWAKSTALYTKAASVLGVGYPEMMVLYALESMGELTQKHHHFRGWPLDITI